MNQHRLNISFMPGSQSREYVTRMYLGITTYPSKHETSTQCWTNVVSPSTTLAQHWSSIGSMFRVRWDMYTYHPDHTDCFVMESYKTNGYLTIDYTHLFIRQDIFVVDDCNIKFIKITIYVYNAMFGLWYLTRTASLYRTVSIRQNLFSIRQNLTYRDSPLTKRIKIFITAVDL